MHTESNPPANHPHPEPSVFPTILCQQRFIASDQIGRILRTSFHLLPLRKILSKDREQERQRVDNWHRQAQFYGHNMISHSLQLNGEKSPLTSLPNQQEKPY